MLLQLYSITVVASTPLKLPCPTPFCRIVLTECAGCCSACLAVVPCENQPRPPKYLPVGAMLQLGSQMLVSGGCVREGAEPAHRLQLWDCKKMKSLREFACRCGPVTCLELLSDVLQPLRLSPSAIESVTSWRSSISEGDMGSGSCSVAYKLLSGHADGQVVLWELTGRGAAPELRELAVIGEYSKDR